MISLIRLSSTDVQVRISQSDIERTPEILRAIESEEGALEAMQRSLASVRHRWVGAQ